MLRALAATTTTTASTRHSEEQQQVAVAAAARKFEMKDVTRRRPLCLSSRTGGFGNEKRRRKGACLFSLSLSFFSLSPGALFLSRFDSDAGNTRIYPAGRSYYSTV